IKIGQRILSRQTLSSDDARTALVYTRAFAKKCRSPHVSKGDTRNPVQRKREKTGTQASLPASSAECGLQIAECGQECPRSIAQART
ncbi:MAG: hypothetical protein ACRD6X_09735, partial [Pyrinomonadaceae bacterium]